MEILYVAILIIRMNLIQNFNISILRFAKEEISFTYHWQEIHVSTYVQHSSKHTCPSDF